MTTPVIIPPYLAAQQDEANNKVSFHEIVELFNHLRQDDPLICVFYIDTIKNVLKRCNSYKYLLDNPQVALNKLGYDFNPYIKSIFEHKELIFDDILYNLIINMDKEGIISYCNCNQKDFKGQYDETYSMAYLYRAKENVDIEIIRSLAKCSYLCSDAWKLIDVTPKLYDCIWSRKNLRENDIGKFIEILNGKRPFIELRELSLHDFNIVQLCSLIRVIIIDTRCTDLKTIKLLNHSLFSLAYDILEKGVDESIKNAVTIVKTEYEIMIMETLNITSLKDTEYSFDKVFPILIKIENMEKITETIIPYDEDDIKGLLAKSFHIEKELEDTNNEIAFEDNLSRCFERSIDSGENIRYITRNPWLEPVHIRFLFNKIINRKDEVNNSEKDAFRELISSLKHPKFNSVFESFSKDIIRMPKHNMWLIKVMSDVIQITEDDICWAVKNRSIAFVNLLDRIKKEQTHPKLKVEKEDISSFVSFRNGSYKQPVETPTYTSITNVFKEEKKPKKKNSRPVIFDMEWKGGSIKADITNRNIDVKEEEGQIIIKINLL
jgi:hypothetical protein